ncbi:MAG: DUF3794 domain-containing protein [Clostridiales bacterium]|nr:DUF3794 domain-containing protein [Clostridiales bacterium]
MAIETLKEKLCVNQIIGKSKENIVIQGDVIIPDIKPDILSTINVNGTVCIYKKEVLDGKIRIDGGVQVYIIYLADDENGSIRAINTVVDFTKIIEMENIKSNMNIESNIKLKDVECRILNGRKININSNLDIELIAYSNENIEYIKNINDKDNIQVLNDSVVANSLLGTANTKVFAKDTINIDTVDNLSEIMNVNINIINKEIKTSYNKILAKADMAVNILYEIEDGSIKEAKKVIPIMGFIDMKDVSDEHICNVNYEIKNMVIKPNNVEEHSIYVEVEIELVCDVYEEKKLDIIRDLYSPVKNLDICYRNITVMSEKEKIKDKCIIKEKIYIPEITANNLCSIEINPSIVDEKLYKDKIKYEGELNVKFIYISNITNKLDVKISKVPFNIFIETKGKQVSNLNTDIEIISQNCVVSTDGSIEINVELEIQIDSCRMFDTQVIDKLDVSDINDENIYSIVVYFVKPGDTLWNIAKKFKSTIKAILSINGIEDENKINIGQQLFIPKFI